MGMMESWKKETQAKFLRAFMLLKSSFSLAVEKKILQAIWALQPMLIFSCCALESKLHTETRTVVVGMTINVH